MGLQRVRQDWATSLNYSLGVWTVYLYFFQAFQEILICIRSERVICIRFEKVIFMICERVICISTDRVLCIRSKRVICIRSERVISALRGNSIRSERVICIRSGRVIYIRSERHCCKHSESFAFVPEFSFCFYWSLHTIVVSYSYSFAHY